MSGDSANGPSAWRSSVGGWGWLLLAVVAGCALPDYAKIEGGGDPATKPDSGEPSVSSCSMDLLAKGGCRSCIAEHCCDEAAACNNGACGEMLEFPLTPVMSVSEKFDALATCMMDNCDTEDTCDVSWGCVGKYKWPANKDVHKFSMRVFNYADANESGIPGITAKLCESSDPGCSPDGGFKSKNVTDSSGRADFQSDPGFTGFFQLEGGATGMPPVPATVQWSQPIYNLVDEFTHQSLAASAVAYLAVASQFHQSPEEKFTPGTGFLITRMHNCLPLRYIETYRQGVNPIGRAQGVKFMFTPSTGASRVFYVDEQAMLNPSLDRTSVRGYAGAIEVMAANITVTATHAESGRVLSTGTLPIREGTIGFMYLMPKTGL